MIQCKQLFQKFVTRHETQTSVLIAVSALCHDNKSFSDFIVVDPTIGWSVNNSEVGHISTSESPEQPVEKLELSHGWEKWKYATNGRRKGVGTRLIEVLGRR